jgi:catechol 2,3-dioxygenase-like lactoylglutathione lyase family enzyme
MPGSWKSFIFMGAAVTALAGQLAHAQPARPKILGLAHAAFYVSDLKKTLAFYHDLLGFDEVFDLKRPDGSVTIGFVKINDLQYVELFTDPKPAGTEDGQLNHIAVYTDSANGMRDYLAAHGVKTPATVPKGRTGNLNFTVRDPDRHGVEIVEYVPDSWTGRDKGKFLPDTRISNHMAHAGILVASLERATSFYTGLLGFKEFWRGNAATSTSLSWVNVQVPDGEDYVEFMLFAGPPAKQDTGTKNHISLTVNDAQAAFETLRSRAGRANYTREIKIQTGVNRKRQINLYDPDGTRVELMEAHTIDGRPAPSSTLAPPN